MIFMTAHDEPQWPEMARRAGAVAFLRKPVEEQALLDAINLSRMKTEEGMPVWRHEMRAGIVDALSAGNTALQVIQRLPVLICTVLLLAAATGCGHFHYPANKSSSHWNPQAGYRGSKLTEAHHDDELPILLSFSGGGTRADIFSYGVLETMRDMEISIFDLANSLLPFLDSKKKPYIHLVDGGVADNLGLRAILERVTFNGSWRISGNRNSTHVVPAPGKHLWNGIA